MEELGDLVTMRPRAAEVAAFGEDLARLVAAARLVNIVVLSVALAAALTRLLPAAATESAISHWPSDQRELIVVDHTGQAGWETATATAVGRWNAAGADVHLTWAAGDGSCDEDGPRIAFCLVEGSELKGYVEYEALTTPSTSADGHANGVFIEACADCGLTELARQVVATHEIGHALGLTHNTRFGSVMFPTGSTGELDTTDSAELRELYAHDD